MKKICSKRIYIIIFAALFALLMALSVFMIFDPFAIKEKNVSKVSPVAVAVAPVSDNNALKSSYFIGDSIEINPLEISDGINTAMSDSAFVSFPGGKVSGAETLVLDEAGKYSVTYYANTAGKRLVYMHEFTVKDEIFTLSNANSALSYGSHPSDTLNQKGIVASIARNDVLRYNKVIDLSKMPADETFLRFFAPPEQIGVADAKQIKLKFTDAYDENNYVEILLKNVSEKGTWADPQAYVTAAPVGRAHVGIEGDDNIHRNDDYGYPCWFSLIGKPYSGMSIGQNTFDLMWDWDNNSVRAANPCVTNQDTTIADFDSTEFFVDPWDGFTTGEVFLEISGLRYQQTHMNLVILNIAGQDLSEAYFEDTDAPVIEVDTLGYAENLLPKAIKGKPYPLFDAKAMDARDGEVEVESRVFYHYGGSTQSQKTVTDGTFIPTVAGDGYSLVYTARDSFGNIAEKVLDINVADEGNEFAFELSGKAVAGSSGQKLKVFDAVSFSNESGNTELSIRAVHKASGTVYNVDNGEFTFIPLLSGEYEIEVKASDYLFDRSETFSVSVAPGDIPAAFEEPVLPHFMIKGATYTLPSLTGYVFSSGEAVESPAIVKIFEDGAEKPDAVKDGNYTVAASSSVEIRYVIGDTAVKSRTIDVIDTGYGADLQMKKYFAAVRGTFEASDNEDSIIYEALTDRSLLEFINIVQVYDFSITFAPLTGKSDFESIDFYLTDIENPEQKLKISFSAGPDGDTLLRVNDTESVYKLPVDFADHGETYYTLSYSNATRSVKCADVNVPLDRIFEGFQSGTAYLQIEFNKKDTGSAAVEILNLNRQSLFNGFRDTMAPQILGSFQKGDRVVGSEVVLSGTYTIDVLDPTVAFSLNVRGPEGEYVVSKEGVSLDGTCDPSAPHTLVLSEPGEYMVCFEAIDSSGRKTSLEYGITAVSWEKPEISLSGGDRSGSVGKSIKIASASVADGVALYAYIEFPNGKIVPIKSHAFVTSEAGTYKVRYIAYDESGNMNDVSYAVTVS